MTWQDGTLRRYHYKDPRFAQALSGITDEAGICVRLQRCGPGEGLAGHR